MAPKGSPSRNTCSPGCSGPTCSTSTCRSISAPLSMPSDRQACENAQVEQKVSASPSSASTLASVRGNTNGEVMRQLPTESSRRARSHRAREVGGCRGGSSGGQVAVEAHGDGTQLQPSPRGGAQAALVQFHQPVLAKRLQALQGLGEILAEIDHVAAAEVAIVQHTVAHQLLDHVGTDHVVL